MVMLVGWKVMRRGTARSLVVEIEVVLELVFLGLITFRRLAVLSEVFFQGLDIVIEA